MLLKLKAVDVGMDLRNIGMPVLVPADATSAEWDGGQVQGSPKKIVKELKKAGFQAKATPIVLADSR
jgi:hypothetical protein